MLRGCYRKRALTDTVFENAIQTVALLTLRHQSFKSRAYSRVYCYLLVLVYSSSCYTQLVLVVTLFVLGLVMCHIMPLYGGARCSSVVRAFAHGAMGQRIDPSWGGPIELFLVPASAPRLV